MELRDELKQALRVMWPGFAARRPGLARCMDSDLVLEAADEDFADDADYQHALADGTARGLSQREMRRLVRGLVRDWLEKQN